MTFPFSHLESNPGVQFENHIDLTRGTLQLEISGSIWLERIQVSTERSVQEGGVIMALKEWRNRSPCDLLTIIQKKCIDLVIVNDHFLVQIPRCNVEENLGIDKPIMGDFELRDRDMI